MKRSLRFMSTLLCGLFLLVATPVSAGGNERQDAPSSSSSAIANNTATAGATAGATIGNVGGGHAGASAVTGPSTATIGDVDLKTGDAAATLTLQQQFTSNGSKIPLQAVPMPGAAPVTPALFIHNGSTNPPQVTGVALHRWAQSLCAQRYQRTSRGINEKQTGQSGDTMIRATLYPDNNNKRFATDVTAPVVSLGLPEAKTEVVCIGVITVQAKSGNGSVDMSTLDNDAFDYALRLEGYPEIMLFSPESAAGGALGVETDGKGFGIGGSGVGIAGAVTAALGLSGGASNGATNPTARLGTTYVIFAKPNSRGGSAVVDPSDYSHYHAKLSGGKPTADAEAPKKDAATK